MSENRHLKVAMENLRTEQCSHLERVKLEMDTKLHNETVKIRNEMEAKHRDDMKKVNVDIENLYSVVEGLKVELEAERRRGVENTQDATHRIPFAPITGQENRDRVSAFIF